MSVYTELCMYLHNRGRVTEFVSSSRCSWSVRLTFTHSNQRLFQTQDKIFVLHSLFKSLTSLRLVDNLFIVRQMSHKVTHIPGEASGTKRHSFVFNFTTILSIKSYFTEVNVNNTGATSYQKMKTII